MDSRLPDLEIEPRGDADGPGWWGYDPVTEYSVTGTREHVEQVLEAVREAWILGYSEGFNDARGS